MERHGGQRTLSLHDFTGNAQVFLDGMLRSGEEIVLTEDGRAVARIAPVEPSRSAHPGDDWSNDE